MSQYVKDFVIGSSWPAFVLYFYGVSTYPDTLKNYSYMSYTFIAPLALGLMNVLGHILANIFELSRTQRFVLTGLIGAIGVSCFITLAKVYNFSSVGEWMTHYVKLLVIYLFVFAVIVNGLDYLVSINCVHSLDSQ